MKGNHNKGGRKPLDQSVILSKKLSYLLRHGAEKEGLEIGADGYVLIDKILQKHDFKKVTLQQIEEIVEGNDKKRFQIITKVDSENGIHGKYIRATQGHSIQTVQDDDLLETITDYKKYPVVVHGTYLKFWDSILKNGLSPMSRNHIHFAVGYPKNKGVISGMRNSCDLYIELDLERAMQYGMKFYISNNNVILSSGNSRCIPAIYFKRVIDINDNVLYENIGQNWQIVEEEFEKQQQQEKENEKQQQQQKPEQKQTYQEQQDQKIQEEEQQEKQLTEQEIKQAQFAKLQQNSSNIGDSWQEIKK